MDRSRFIRGLLSDPVDPQLPQYVPENDFGPRAFGLLNTLFPDPYEATGDAIRQYRGGDPVGAFETMFGAMPTAGALKVGRAEQTVAMPATRSVQPEGLLSPSVRPEIDQSINMKPPQVGRERLDVDAILTKEDWRAKMDELSAAVAELDGKNADLAAVFATGKSSVDDVASLFNKYGVNVRHDVSSSWSDRYGPSNSNYFHFDTPAGETKTFRLSDHNYLPNEYDYRFSTPIQRIENDLLNVMGINSSNEMLDKYRQYLSNRQIAYPIEDDLSKLGDMRVESLPSVNSKRHMKRLAAKKGTE